VKSTPRTPGPKRFPLWQHKASGLWCKKVRGEFLYFGRDKDEALREYGRYLTDPIGWRSGRDRQAGDLTVRTLFNRFLHAKRQLVDTGELAPSTWGEYFATAERAIGVLGPGRVVSGLSPDDFAKLRTKAAATLGPVALGKFVQLTRTMLRWGFENGHLETPVRFGSSFDKPTRRVLRVERNRRGSKMVEAAECWKLIDAADVPLRAQIFLALNCGYGQTDLSNLTRTMLAARPGWIDYPRPKTGTPRRCSLWPETVDALAAAASERPDPADHADRDAVFLTPTGKRLVRFRDKGGAGRGTILDALAHTFAKLAKRCGVRASFYNLRHVHRTVSDGAKDQPAADLIMGHTHAGMSSVYREHIADERLDAVVKHVWSWLQAGRPRPSSVYGSDRIVECRSRTGKPGLPTSLGC
jgi:integrase